MPPHLPADFFERLVEHPIRLQVLLSQTRAGLWVRNGFAALKPATLYRSSAFGEVFMLPDLLLLQFGLLQLGMSRFVSRASTLFGLPRFWAVLAGTVPEEQEDASKTPLAEDLLHMLIMVLCDRSLAGAPAPPPPRPRLHPRPRLCTACARGRAYARACSPTRARPPEL